MSQTPDRRPGALEEDEEIRLITNAVPPTQVGAFNFDGSAFVMRDSIGNFNPRDGFNWQVEHETLRQLIHLADGDGPMEGFASGAFQTTSPGGAFPTSFIWWESSAMLKKIVEETVTYNGNKTIATDQWKVYATDGTTVLATVTDTISYSGVFETNRTRTVV